MSQKKKSPTSVEQTTNLNSNSNEKHATVERIDVPDSPFLVVGDPQSGYVGIMGNYRLTEPHATSNEAVEAVKEINWNNIVRVISCILHREVSNPFINS